MDLKDFFIAANKLKDVKRTGWVEREVKDPESVADHSFMMALMCMVVPAEGIDREKAIKMALVHDLAEAEIGDIITKEHWEEKGTMTRAEKVKLEGEAMKKLVSNLERGAAEEIVSLWKEHEEGKTKEAVFVNDIDHMERMLQAHIYHKKGNFSKPLEGFWDEKSMNLIKNEKVKKLVRDIIGMGQ